MLKALTHIPTDGEARAQPRVEGVKTAFLNQFWDLRASRDLDYTERAVWRHFVLFLVFSFELCPPSTSVV